MRKYLRVIFNLMLLVLLVALGFIGVFILSSVLLGVMLDCNLNPMINNIVVILILIFITLIIIDGISSLFNKFKL